MSLDLAALLQESIRLDHSISEEKDIHLPREAAIQNAYVALDVELAEVANNAEWFKVWKEKRGTKAVVGKTHRQTLLEEYVDALDFYLLVASKQTWSHLIVMDEAALKALSEKKPDKNLNQHYLVMKQQLFESHFNHRQEAFRHSWRLFLKMGLVDFGFSEDEIQAAYLEKNGINYDRQNSGY